MTGQILSDVKAELGLLDDYTPFDRQLVSNINAVLMVLTQLGVGTPNFRVTLSDPANSGTLTSQETWTQFLAATPNIDVGALPSYVAIKVKLLFDPPASGTLMESYKKLADEFEFRLNVASGV